MTAVVPEIPTPAEVPVQVVTNNGASVSVPFYALSVPELPSGKFSVNNPFFDPNADYVVFGTWSFKATGGSPPTTFTDLTVTNSFTCSGAGVAAITNVTIVVGDPASVVDIAGSAVTVSAGALNLSSTGLAALNFDRMEILCSAAVTNKLQGAAGANLLIDSWGDIALNPVGTLQVGGSTTVHVTIGGGTTSTLGISLAPGGTITLPSIPTGVFKILYVDTATGQLYRQA